MKVKLYRQGKTKELEDFVKQVNLPEAFGYDAPFIFEAHSKGQFRFVNAFRLQEVDGVIMPRFIHILLDDSIKRSRVAIDLMKQAEAYLNLLGYTRAFAYILKDNRLMSILAQKFGYNKDKEDDKAFYYFKCIGGN